MLTSFSYNSFTTKSLNTLISLFFIIILASCSGDSGREIDATPPPPEGSGSGSGSDDGTQNSSNPNILLIIADDMGKDATNGFTEGEVKPLTPHLDSIQNTGLSFNNFWAYPVCSPTRASILTGKYGYRTDVKWANDILSEDEEVLQAYINRLTDNLYATAVIGKWHVSGNNATFNPESFGIDFYSGIISGAVGNYFEWQLTEDSSRTRQTEYATTVLTDIAIDWVNQQPIDKPWFLWLAYNAPHTPFHAPPSNMHSQGNLAPYEDGMNAMPYYMAAIEAMDYQIGELLDSIPADQLDNTIIIFMGDNGTPESVAQAPYQSDSAKGSLFQGGINTPLFITGKGVTRTGLIDNLATSTDLFSTIAEIAGIENPNINDSISLMPLFTEDGDIRDFQYSEKEDGVVDLWSISNGDYKLIINANGGKQLYQLRNDPYEQQDLIPNRELTASEQAAVDSLETALTEIRSGDNTN